MGQAMGHRSRGVRERLGLGVAQTLHHPGVGQLDFPSTAAIFEANAHRAYFAALPAFVAGAAAGAGVPGAAAAPSSPSSPLAFFFFFLMPSL